MNKSIATDGPAVNPTPVKKYSIILSDPPWSFDVWSEDTGNGRSPSAHYRTMDLNDICSLPVADIAADNCALFLWAVWPRIFDARDVIEAWGFRYVTLAWEWMKLNRSGVGWHVGMGYYCRANVEPCLLAVRGNMPVAVRNERNTIIEYEDNAGVFSGLPMGGFLGHCLELPMVAPIGRHSQKPAEQYRKIEALYPDLPRVELFARRPVDGWTCLGNEIDGLDITQALTQEAAR